MSGNRLEPYQHFLALTVPGLAENRPSVMRGDVVLVRPVGEHKCYRGYAHRVELSRVLLKFHQDLHRSGAHSRPVDVQFTFSKTVYRLMLQGLSLAGQLPREVYLPTLQCPLQPAQLATRPENLQPIDGRLNERQAIAVCGILEGRCRPRPYLIFGPPGTGKTSTLVEAVLQFLRRRPGAHLLVCAPSNTAADLLIQRLRGYLKPADMLRLNAWSREPSDVPNDVWPYTTMASGRGGLMGFPMPPLADLLERTVTVATCVTAARLVNCGVPRGHYDLIVVDEAGHPCEPEATAAPSALLPADSAGGGGGSGSSGMAAKARAVLALAVAKLVGDKGIRAKGAAGSGTLLVLAGDPCQLGPIVRSDMARTNGLQMSILERLMARPPYVRRGGLGGDAVGGYDSALLTKLVRNYRSHPDILRLPNRLFYDGELVACADAALVRGLESWPGLPRPGFPLMFHGVEGRDVREGNSPSWFNVEECLVVEDYVRALTARLGAGEGGRGAGVEPREVGVITPYNRQAYKLRQLLREGLSAVTVGSTEQFQGLERHVIIISTVRSTDSFVDFDLQHNLGFLSNPKRFNVAVTRAKALLIVVGNPHLLAADEHWGALLWYCVDHGGYTGCSPPPRAAGDGFGGGEAGDNGLDAGSSSEEDGGEGVRQQLAGMSLVAVGEAEEEEEEQVEDSAAAGPSAVEAVEGPAWRRDE